MNNIHSGKALIDRLEEDSKRFFTLSEAVSLLHAPRKNVLNILSYLIRQKKISTLTQGLYALWPAEERRHGLVPLPLIEPLMSYCSSPYYISLLSAAGYYGTAYQKPQVLQVMIPKRITLRKAANLRLDFHVFGQFPKVGINKIKHSFGYVNYSSPELTALDLLYFQSAAGQFGNVSLVVRDLIPMMNKKAIMDTINNYPINACVQRLGFMIEHSNINKELLFPFREWMKVNKPQIVKLAAAYPRKGKVDKYWKIALNADVEVEY